MIIKQSNSSKDNLGYSCGTNYAIQHLSYDEVTHQLILKQNPDIVFYIDLNLLKDKDRILHLNPVEDIIETTPSTPNDNVNYVVHDLESGKYEYYNYNVKLHNWNTFTLITGCEFYNKANNTKYLYDGINLIDITHVNLSAVSEQDKITVNNDKGTGFELLLATNTEAGLISPEEKSIINIISNEGFVSTASIQDVSNKLSLAIKTYNPITKDYTVSTYGLREFELGKNGLVPAPEEARDDVFLNAKGKWVKLEFGELANTVVNAIAAETARAKDAEAKLKLAISEETKRATKAEESIKTLVSTNTGELATLKEAYKEADIEVLKTLRDEIKVISDTKVNIEQGKELMPSPNVDEDLKNSYFLSADGTWKKIETDDYVFVLEANIPETITSETAVSLLNPNEAERYLKYYLEYIQNTNITKPSLFLKDINGNYPSVLLAPIGLDINTNKYVGISYYKETLYKPIVTFDYNVSKKNIQIFNVTLKIDLVKIATHDYVENAANKLRDIITTLLQNKVDKEEGKTLTTNDFTDAYKGVIDRIEEYINNIEIIAPSDSEDLVLASNKYSPITDSTVTVEQLFPNVTDTHSGLMTPSYKRALDNFVIDNTEMNIYGTPANRWQIDTTVDGPVFINRVGYVDFKAGLEKESYANLVLNDINIKGVVKHEGTSFISNAQIIKFGDNTIEINSNETGEGVSDILAGIEIYRGTLPKYNIYYDDADKILKSGETNGLYPILNTDYLVDLTDTMFLGWDRVTKRAKTTNKTGHAIYSPAFFRSPDNSETLYHADIVNDLTTGGTDKVLAAEVGKEIFKAIEEGTKYNSMFNDPEMPTTKTVGGIAAGTKLSKLEGKTFSQLFDNALFTEMQPSVTAPSASLRLSFTTLLEVGAPAPVKSNFTTGYSRGSATVAGQTNRYRAGILRPDESFIYYGGNANNKDMYPEKVILGSMSWNYRAYHEQGDELVTSWGNKASINPNPLPAGYVTSSAVSISGTYPFFTNGQSCSSSSQDTNLPSTAGNMVKMALMSWGTTLVGIKFASEAATNVRLAFQFPQAKTVTKVEFFNTVSGKWEVFGNANWNIRDIEDKTVQGNPVKYSELTTTGALSGALQLRFTIANSGRPINDTTLRKVLNDFNFLDVNNDITNISDTGNRAEGVAKFAVNFEPGGQAPLDARTLVTTRADLINPNTYYAKNYYQGLYAITKDTQELWVLKDVTKITSPDYSGWKRLDVGAVPIVDNLNSTSTTSALSANQGKVLNEKIESLSSDVDSNYLKLTGGTLTGIVNFNAGLNVNSGNTVVQNITIKGNVTQEGDSFITKAETVNITDNILILNNGEKGSGVTKGTSGIEVDRGSADNFLFVFDEADDRFKAGYANSLQPIMLRDAESSLVANKFLYWDATNKISKTREIVISDISNLHNTWGSFLGSGIYTRNIGINGYQWTFISNVNAATPSIYAPITPGSAGQYLKSSGGVPVWNTLTMSDISDSANILNEYLPLSAGSIKPLTGMLYANEGILVPSGTGIKMWKENFYTWVEYMRAASEPSPTGGTLGTYGNVTSYARRSLIENISGYGWIWESCANEANVNTNPMMALSSVNGNLYVKGDITAPTFRGDVVGNATTSNSFQNPFTFTIGLTSKNVKGDAPISYSLAEIGALPLTGGSMTANARISFPSTNLYIGNSDNLGWLYLQDVASQSGPDYWRIVNTGVALFRVSVTSSKFIKSGSSDEYVLLGAGGHKAISDFATSGHKHDYLPLSGGTLTGKLEAKYGVTIQGGVEATFNKNLNIDGSSGYARNILTFSLNGTSLAQIGAYGIWDPSIPNIEDCIDYIYMSPTYTEYSGKNFKIYKDKITWNNADILNADNYHTYALPVTGGTVTGPIYLNSDLVLPSNSQGDYSVCLKTAAGSLITGLYFPTDDSVKYGNKNFNKVTIASNSGVSLTHLKGDTEYTIYDSGNFPGSITSEANKYVMRDDGGFIQGGNINTSHFQAISCKEHWVRIAKVDWGIFHLYGQYRVGGMTSLVFSISTSYRNKDGSCLTLLSGNKLSTVTKLRLTLEEETSTQYLELKYSYIQEGEHNNHRLYASLGGCEHINPWEEVPEELPTGWRVLDVLDVNHDGVATTGKIKTHRGIQLGANIDACWYDYKNVIAAGSNADSKAGDVNMGSLLVSDRWIDRDKVSTNGIYSKGLIHAHSGIISEGVIGAMEGVSVLPANIYNLNSDFQVTNSYMVINANSSSQGAPSTSGDYAVININGSSGNYSVQIAVNWGSPQMYFRSINPTNGSSHYSWARIASTTYVDNAVNELNYAASNTPGGPALTVIDSGDNSSTIKLAYRGDSLTASSTSYLAGFSSTLNNGSRVIRDISAAEALKFIGAAPSNHVHTTIKGIYEYDGGVQAPSYFTSGTSRFNMMYKNLVGGGGGYCDWLVMDNYTGNDVPYITGIGVLKANIPEAFIISGPKGSEDKSTWVRRKLATVEDDLTWDNIKNKPSSFTPSAHNHSLLKGWADTRSTAETPDSYNNAFEVKGIKYSSIYGINSGNYVQVFGFRGWADSSGGDSHEFALADNGKIYHRNGATTSWSAWNQIAYTTDIPTIPSLSGGAAATSGQYVSGVTVSGHTITVMKAALPTIPTSLKCPHALTIQQNGITLGTYDGSAAKTVNITATSVQLTKASVMAALNTAGTNTFTQYCDFTAGAGNSGSDMRFKTNISPINNILSDLMKIKIFTYTWNKLGERQLDTLGVSANDLEDNSLFTKLVHERPDEDKTKFVDYDRIGVLALKGVQELAEENIKLKRALKALILELDIKLDI